MDSDGDTCVQAEACSSIALHRLYHHKHFTLRVNTFNTTAVAANIIQGALSTHSNNMPHRTPHKPNAPGTEHKYLLKQQRPENSAPVPNPGRCTTQTNTGVLKCLSSGAFSLMVLYVNTQQNTCMCGAQAQHQTCTTIQQAPCIHQLLTALSHTPKYSSTRYTVNTQKNHWLQHTALSTILQLMIMHRQTDKL